LAITGKAVEDSKRGVVSKEEMGCEEEVESRGESVVERRRSSKENHI
jgi:hypothetical protein